MPKSYKMWAFKDDEGVIWATMIHNNGDKTKKQAKADLFSIISNNNVAVLKKLNSYVRKGGKIVKVTVKVIEE